MSARGTIAIVIPALNPPPGLVDYVRDLRARTSLPILLVDDGSRPERKGVFADCAAAASGVGFLSHGSNRGKGRALKTAFARLLAECPDLVGCVTCDGDGQHRPGDVLRCAEELERQPGALVLGCRTFSLSHVPWRSRLGNNAMRSLFRLVTGRGFLDTQTGLRSIPADFMRALLDCPGERFEFETHMLLRMGDRPLVQLPIETVYHDGNSESHFDPFRDSARIVAILLREGAKRLSKFIAASLLSFGVDIGLFTLLYAHVLVDGARGRLFLSVAAARAVSVVFNYLCNRHFVFAESARRHAFGRAAFPKYLLLAAVQMAASYGLLKAAVALSGAARAHVAAAKAAVDIALFFLSYGIQRVFVFPLRRQDAPPS